MMKLKGNKCAPEVYWWRPLLLQFFENPIHFKNLKNNQFFFFLGNFLRKAALKNEERNMLTSELFKTTGDT